MIHYTHFRFSRIVLYALVLVSFSIFHDSTQAEPISIPPDYVITSPTGNIEVGVSSRYGGAIAYYKDKRIPDNTIANGNIIDYSNGGTLFTTAIWTQPTNPAEQTYCNPAQKNNLGRCRRTIPFNNPTQGGYLGDGHAGNPNPTSVRIEGGKIIVSYRSVNYNYGYGDPVKPLTPENEFEWQTDFWGDVEISFHPSIPDVVVIDTKITYCKDLNPRCANTPIRTADNQLSTLFSAGRFHPDPHFRGPYTRLAFTSSRDGVVITETLPYSPEGPMKEIQSYEGWVATLQENSNNGIGMAVRGLVSNWTNSVSLFGKDAKDFPLYSVNGWPVMTASKPIIHRFENEGVFNQSIDPAGWYKFRTYTATGDIAEVRHKLRRALLEPEASTPAPAFGGYVDIMSCTEVTGWAAIGGSPSLKNIKVVVSSLADSRVKREFIGVNNITRPDLGSVCPGGLCGFSIPVSNLPEGKSRVDVFISDGSRDLLLQTNSTLLGPCNRPQIVKFELASSEIIRHMQTEFRYEVSRDTERVEVYIDDSTVPAQRVNHQLGSSQGGIGLVITGGSRVRLVATNSVGTDSREIPINISEPLFRAGDIVRLSSHASEFSPVWYSDFSCGYFFDSKAGSLMKIGSDGYLPRHRGALASSGAIKLWQLTNPGHSFANGCGYFMEQDITKVTNLPFRANDVVKLTASQDLRSGPEISASSIVGLVPGDTLTIVGPEVQGNKLIWKARDASNRVGYLFGSDIVKFTPDRVPVGEITSASCESIEGWAYDPDSPSQEINIHFYDRGAGVGPFITYTVTDIEDVSLNTSKNISGEHNFSIKTPASLKDGQEHSIYAYGINSLPLGQNSTLTGSDAKITCLVNSPASTPTINSFQASSVSIEFGSSAVLSWSISNSSSVSISPNIGLVSGVSVSVSPTQTTTYIITATNSAGSSRASATITVMPPTPTSTPTVTPTPTIPPENSRAPIGTLDAADCSIIGGWAYDPDSPSSIIGIHIYENGAGAGPLIAATTTSGERSDVNQAFNITGNHGYTIRTPASLKDGTDRVVRAYAIDNEGNTLRNAEVSGSPKTFNCAPQLSFWKRVFTNLRALLASIFF